MDLEYYARLLPEAIVIVGGSYIGVKTAIAEIRADVRSLKEESASTRGQVQKMAEDVQEHEVRIAVLETHVKRRN